MSKNHEASLSPRVQAVSEELRLVLKRLVREMRRDASENGGDIPLVQYMLLSIIQDQPGIGVADLARLENVRTATMSGHVKAMEEAGLLERSAPDPQDRRRSGLLVTQLAAERIEALRDKRRDWMSRRIARLTPSQLAALEAAIEPLNEIGQP
ncbi:MarR family winged helix-turn-helix transcriptional regulator [Pseudoduganella violaceinigra]|uniref:MarR family winged helix-turn-helix transcriptional regulator n=1 Tax=Pseudoduganella violaceinigra TaxID=246602 RepID=UPI0004035203|nr:MarR family transcriptional regulator [Pseudoduganella violaceinigra]